MGVSEDSDEESAPLSEPSLAEPAVGNGTIPVVAFEDSDGKFSWPFTIEFVVDGAPPVRVNAFDELGAETTLVLDIELVGDGPTPVVASFVTTFGGLGGESS